MNKKSFIIKILELLIYIICYTIVLFIIDFMFDSFKIGNIWYGFLAVLIISILNRTIKPVLFKYTLPLIGMTFGLFYPFINLFILKIVSFILGDHFVINGIWIGVIIAILISIMNFIMEEAIIKPIIRRCNNE
jgi:putative membrane protein